MIDFIKDWTVSIVMLVLFIVMIEMLLPQGKMKKYVNLLTGTILIIVIIEPIVGLLGRDFDFSASQTAAAESIDRKEIEKAGKLLEEEQMRQTVELYRSRIIEQIEQNAMEVEGVKDVEADIIINEDYQSEYFGEIKRIYIKAVVGNDSIESSNNGSKKNNAKIDKMTITNVEGIMIDNRTKDVNSSMVFDAELNGRLSRRIAEVFGADIEDIIIEQIQR